LQQGIAAACGVSWLALAAIHRRFASGLLLTDPMREPRESIAGSQPGGIVPRAQPNP